MGRGGAGFFQTRKTLQLQLPTGPPGVRSLLFVLRWVKVHSTPP